jgi:CTP synthase (UTP-ammonia lyase)
MDTEYKIAEWLLVNEQAVKADVRMRSAYRKAATLNKEEACEFVLNNLKYIIKEYNKQMDLFDIEAALNDERVAIIVNKYYLKDWVYEH